MKALRRQRRRLGGGPCCPATHDDGDDLEQAQPVLQLTVGADGKDVDGDEGDEKDEAEGPAGEVVGPVLQDELQGDQVGGGGDGIVEPVVPGEGEAKGIVDEAAGPRRKPSVSTLAASTSRARLTQQSCRSCRRRGQRMTSRPDTAW